MSGFYNKKQTSKDLNNTSPNIRTNVSLDTNARILNAKGAIEIPSLTDICNFVIDNGLVVEAYAFYSVNKAREWKIEGVPIQNWRALLLSWNAKEIKERRGEANER